VRPFTESNSEEVTIYSYSCLGGSIHGHVERDQFALFQSIWRFKRLPNRRVGCHGSRGKLVRTCEQKVNKEEKLTLAFHRNLLIFLGKLPLR
jgi:hypothetical protein